MYWVYSGVVFLAFMICLGACMLGVISSVNRWHSVYERVILTFIFTVWLYYGIFTSSQRKWKGHMNSSFLMYSWKRCLLLGKRRGWTARPWGCWRSTFSYTSECIGGSWDSICYLWSWSYNCLFWDASRGFQLGMVCSFPQIYSHETSLSIFFSRSLDFFF